MRVIGTTKIEVDITPKDALLCLYDEFNLSSIDDIVLLKKGEEGNTLDKDALYRSVRIPEERLVLYCDNDVIINVFKAVSIIKDSLNHCQFDRHTRIIGH